MESYYSSDDEIVWEALNLQEIRTTRVFAKHRKISRQHSEVDGYSLPSSSTSNTDNTVTTEENFDIPGPSSYFPPEPSDYELEFLEFFEGPEREAALNLNNPGHDSVETVITISSDEEDSRDKTQKFCVRECCTKKNDDVIVISDDSSNDCMEAEQLAQMNSGKQQNSANNGNNK